MSGNKIDRFDCTNGGAQWCYGCYRMENDCDGDYVRYEDYESRITALEAENARLRADAERYRWLKEKCGFGIRKNQVTELSVMFHTLPGSIHKLDDAIDAELVEEQK